MESDKCELFSVGEQLIHEVVVLTMCCVIIPGVSGSIKSDSEWLAFFVVLTLLIVTNGGRHAFLFSRHLPINWLVSSVLQLPIKLWS